MTVRMVTGLASGISATALALCMATGAAAQPVAAAAPTAATGGIEDIVVTAQRRAERLQNVPISITAVTASAIQAAGVVTTESLPQLAPGLVITRANESPQIYLRGVGTQQNGPGEEGAVNVYVDGVLVPALSAAAFGLANVERIEVLKGPQGTLFGRNSSGGTIHVITRTPSFTPSAQASFGFGNYDTVDSQFYGTTPLGSAVAVDLALSYHDQGNGFGKNIFNGQDIYKANEYTARSKLLLQAGEDTSFVLAGDYSKVTSSFGNGRAVLPGAIGVGGSLYTGNFYNINNNLQPLSKVKQWGVSLKAEHDLGFANLVNLTAYRRADTRSFFDVEGSPFRVVDFDRFDKVKQFTEELQIQSQSGSPVQWIGGVYFLKGSTEFTGFINGAGAGPTLYSETRSKMDTTSIAGFAQATVPLGEKTQVTAGARYTQDKREFVGTQTFLPGAPPSRVVPSAAFPNVPGKKTYEKLTYRFALDHKLTEDIMAYVSYSRGFKSGLYNGSNIINPPVNPETLDALEVGVKSDLFDRRLRLNLAGFRYWYNDVQLVQRVGGFQFLLNAAKAKVLGLEGDVVAEPVNNLTFNFSASALFDANYKSFPGAPFSVNNGVLLDSQGTVISPTQIGFPGGVICTPQPVVPVGGNRGGCLFDASGNRMTRAPKLTFTAGFKYELPTEIGKFGIAANYTRTSHFFFEPDNRIAQPTYGLLNGQLSWRTDDDQLGVRLWARNLLDKKYLNFVSVSSADVYAAGNPRTYGVAVDTKF